MKKARLLWFCQSCPWIGTHFDGQTASSVLNKEITSQNPLRLKDCSGIKESTKVRPVRVTIIASTLDLEKEFHLIS